MALIFGTDCPNNSGMNDSVSELTSFRSIMALWPSLEALALDIGATHSTTRKWSQRGRIPAEWWSQVLSTERAKTAGVTSDLLTRLAAREEVRA